MADAAHKAFARRAHADEKDAPAAAREFLVLYKELRADTRLPTADRRELLGKVRGRLVRLSQMIARVVAHRLGLAGQQPATVATIGNPAGVLAGRAGGRRDGDARRRRAQRTRCRRGSEPGRSDPDHHRPGNLDVNGGPGSIYYWRNQHVLVIRATDDVHGFVGDVIDQLQRAGN